MSKTRLTSPITCWATAVEHDQLKAGQQRMRKHVTEKVSELQEQLDALSEQRRKRDKEASSD